MPAAFSSFSRRLLGLLPPSRSHSSGAGLQFACPLGHGGLGPGPTTRAKTTLCSNTQRKVGGLKRLAPMPTVSTQYFKMCVKVAKASTPA